MFRVKRERGMDETGIILTSFNLIQETKLILQTGCRGWNDGTTVQKN